MRGLVFAVAALSAVLGVRTVRAQEHTMFPKGTWSFQTYGSTTLDLIGDDDGEIYLAHAGAGYYFIDNLAINLEGVAGYLDPNDGVASGHAFGFDLLLRWHVLNFDEPGISVYLDGGAGMIWFDDAFPDGGTHQNFTPQAGGGILWRIQEDLHLMTGARWHHVSNARKDGKEHNPGHDGLMLYAGLQLTF